MSIETYIQSYYNQKVAESEAKNISKYDLASEYLGDARKWNNASFFGFPFYSFFGLNNLFDLYNHKKSLQILKSTENNPDQLNLRAEIYKKNLIHSRPFYLARALVHSFMETYATSQLLFENLNQNSFIFLASVMIGAAPSAMYSVKILQYSYIISSDSTSKGKKFSLKKKWPVLTDKLDGILHRPSLT